MSKKNKDEMIVKYTLMPLNEDDDYEHFFSLSLRELAKNTKDKSLLAPLIIYNSELDVPMDNDLEEYTIYCNKSQILEVIKKQEVNDVFRTLILHGFDISFDEIKEVYIAIARRNCADLCVNVIQDTGMDSNISLYIDSCIETSDDKLWEMQKKEMHDEIDDLINNYDSYEVYDYSEEEIENVEAFLSALFGENSFLDKKKKDKKEEKKNTIIPLNLQSIEPIQSSADIQEKNCKEDKQVEEDVVAYSFETNNDVVKVSCIDEDLFLIEENDYEVALNLDQMEFVVECYYKILDYLKVKKSRR